MPTVQMLASARRVAARDLATVGLGRAELRAHRVGATMLGWADPRNVVDGVAETLEARALWVEHGGSAVVVVLVELCFVTAALRRAVLARLADLGLDEGGVVLLATHNHSGPGGFDEHVWFNLSTPGPAPDVLDGLADGCAEAVRRARADRSQASLELVETDVDGVAFNRSLAAWRRNPEARAGEAISRVMTGLVARAPDGRPRGVLSFYGLHGTTLRGDQRLIRPDHKGRAARMLEAEIPGFVALMAQGPAGDQSPNGHHDDDGRARGPGRDDLQSRELVARVQADAVLQLLATPGEPVHGDVGGVIRPLRMEGAVASAKHTGGRAGCRATAPSVGLAMGQGTAEGPGPLHRFAKVNAALSRLALLRSRLRGRDGDDARFRLLDLSADGSRRFLGFLPARALPGVCASTRWYRSQPREIDRSAWAPEVLPMQVVRIGQVAIAAMPCEPTLVAGERVARALEEAVGGRVLVAPYANAYASYAATPEEYRVQAYEGASTLYGRWTVPVMITALERVAVELIAPSETLGATRLEIRTEVGRVGERIAS